MSVLANNVVKLLPGPATKLGPFITVTVLANILCKLSKVFIACVKVTSTVYTESDFTVILDLRTILESIEVSH